MDYFLIGLRAGLFCVACMCGCSATPNDSFSNAVVPLQGLKSFEPAPAHDAQPKVSASTIGLSAPDYSRITRAALRVSDGISAAKGAVSERRQFREILKWEARPALIPAASINTNTSRNELGERDSSIFRLSLQQQLLDFGRFASRAEQATTDISLAMVDHWEERNQAVSDALVLYTDLIHFRDLTDISSKYIDIHKDLKRKIQARLDGGVAEHSELSLITIRLQELLLQEATDLRAMEATRAELEQLTQLSNIELPVDFVEIPEGFSQDNLDILDSPTVVRARKNLQLAKVRKKEARSNSLPSLQVEVYIQDDLDDTEHGVELSLEASSFAGFSYGANLRGADVAINTARTALEKATMDVDRELSRLERENENLRFRKESLQQQYDQTQKAVVLYLDQFQSGVKSMTDAIGIYESTLDVERQLAIVEADLRQNGIATANIYGAIAEYPES